MGEVSNKTLATLLIAAIVVSLVGTLISLNKVDSLLSITGMQTTSDTEQGDVNVTINASAGILIRNNIDFGSGQIPEDQINISTDSINGPTTGGFTNCNVGPACAGMDVENVGNVDVELNVSFSLDADAFIGGDLVGGPIMEIYGANDSQGVAVGGCFGILNPGSGDIANGTDYTLCSNLTDGLNANFVTMEVNLTLPGNALGSATAKQNVVTMTATELV